VTEVEESNKKKVLIVDDELGIRRLVRKMLSGDYAVLEAQDGGEAVNTARSEKPDVILMDMMMPRIDGLTACYAIKTDRATKEIPVIMLTAVGYDLNKKLSQDVMGADGYITKPFSPQELLRTIECFLRNADPAKGSSQL
jgi:two-component system alkaline phosphatase synthesis response regulator PhoP